MRLILTVLLALPLLAVSNKVTLQDKSGTSHGTRQFVIPRYFAQDEICSNPKPYIGGSAVTYWQSHVENRWPASAVCAGGAAKFAVIIIETELLGGGSVDVAFRNSTDACHLGGAATCSAAGMSKADLLNFDAGGGTASWGAKLQATTGGITMSRSARTMISSDHYQIIRNGPIYAEVLVREGPDAVSTAATRTTNFGWKCTASCIGPYTTATWADDAGYYSIRPTFWLRFYRRWQKVEVDFVGHTGWMDRFVDQRIDSWELFTGGAEDTVSASGTSAFILSPRQTWWEGPVWDGGTPPRSSIDFNTAYLVASRLIPPLRTDATPSALTIASEVSAFNSSDQGVTTSASLSPALGVGQTARNMSVSASNPYSIGVFTRWTARYLASQDADLFDVVLGNARGIMHFPVVYLENRTSGTWTAGSAASPFGKVVSIELRPTFVSWYADSSLVAVGERVTSPGGVVMASGCSGCYVYGSGPWVSAGGGSWNSQYMDKAHQSNDLFIPYVITGKRLFLEQLQAQAAWNVATTTADAFSYGITHALGRQRERGLIDPGGNFPRGMFWTVKALGWAAVISPDGSPEKAYFTRILNNNIEAMEGIHQLTSGSFPPASSTAPYGCPSSTTSAYYQKPSSYASAWCHGRYVWINGWDNPLGYPGLQTTASGTPVPGSNTDVRYGGDRIAFWMYAYGAVTYGHLRDLGVTQIGPIQESVSKFFMRAAADSATALDMTIFGNYKPAITNPTNTGLILTPGALYNAVRRSAKLARPATAGATSFFSTTICTAAENCPGVEVQASAGGPVRVGSEVFVVEDWVYNQCHYWIGSASATTDRITFTSKRNWPSGATFAATHDFTDGNLITVANGNPSSIADLPISADATNCDSPSGKAYCTYYVKVIDPVTLELYKDAALTQKVDFLSDVASVYAGVSEWKVKASELGKCGGVSCRGQQGTTVTSHVVGETVNPVGSYMRSTYLSDTDTGYAHHYRVALAYAASYGASITDSITGKPVSGSRAYGLVSGYTAYQDGYANNPRWGWVSWPEVAPTNVRVSGGTGTATLRWVAPDGGACRYAVASSFDNPDDSSDTSDGGGHKSRAATVSLAAGTYTYRISCGNGRATGVVTVQ